MKKSYDEMLAGSYKVGQTIQVFIETQWIFAEYLGVAKDKKHYHVIKIWPDEDILGAHELALRPCRAWPS